MELIAKMAMFRRILAYGVFVLGAATQISATTLTSSTKVCTSSKPASTFSVNLDSVTQAIPLVGTAHIGGVNYADAAELKTNCEAVCVGLNTGGNSMCHGYIIDTSVVSGDQGNCITYLGAESANLELETTAEWTTRCSVSDNDVSFYIIDRRDTCGILTKADNTYTTVDQGRAMCANPNSALQGSVVFGTEKPNGSCDAFNAKETKYHECLAREIDAANAKAGVTGTPMTFECGRHVFGSCYNEYTRGVAGEDCCADHRIKHFPSVTLTADEQKGVNDLCKTAVEGKALSQEHLDKLKNEGILCSLGVLSSPAGTLHTPSPFHTFVAGVFMTYLASSVSGLA